MDAPGLSTGLLIGVTSLLTTVLAGYPLLGWLQNMGVRQNISTDAPERHATKQGTPTMGGLVLVASVVVAGGLAAALEALATRAAIMAALTFSFGAIGFLDDWLIIRRGRNLGLSAPQKLLLQGIAGAVFAAWLAVVDRRPTTTLICGFNLGFAYYLLCILLTVGLSNATNLTDGLDGLSAGMSAAVFAGMGLLGGRDAWPAWLMSGACCGLLWFNVHPALVFMGNTGSLALGAAMAAMGVLYKLEIPLIVATAVFWAETLSVMAQVAVFKWRKRTRGIEYARAHRLFRRAPLHHHFEEMGWPETRIVGRFWLATCVATGVAIVVGRTGYV